MECTLENHTSILLQMLSFDLIGHCNRYRFLYSPLSSQRFSFKKNSVKSFFC